MEVCSYLCPIVLSGLYCVNECHACFQGEKYQVEKEKLELVVNLLLNILVFTNPLNK